MLKSPIFRVPKLSKKGGHFLGSAKKGGVIFGAKLPVDVTTIAHLPTRFVTTHEYFFHEFSLFFV